MKKSIISIAVLTLITLLSISGSYAAKTAGAAKSDPSAQYLQIIQIANQLADPSKGDATIDKTKSTIIVTYTDVTGTNCWTSPKIPYRYYDSVVVCSPGERCDCRKPIKEISINPQPLSGQGSPVAYAPIKITINPKNNPKITTTQIIIYQDPSYPPVWNNYHLTTQGKILASQQEK